MIIPDYWLDIFSQENWQVFLDEGSNISGFSESHWVTVQKIKQGDYLLCYLKKVSRLIGCLEVISEPFLDYKPIWQEDVFPSRVRVNVIVSLTPENAIPIKSLENHLSIFKPENPKSWEGFVRNAPRRWKTSDDEIIVDALLKAQSNSVV